MNARSSRASQGNRKGTGDSDMAIPWSMLGALVRVVAPSIPDLVSTVSNLRTAQQRQQVETTSTEMRLKELEKSFDEQLLLIEQLTMQIEKVEKAYRTVSFIGVLALVLAAIAIGIAVLK